MVNQQILELDPNENKTKHGNWETQEKRHKTQYGYRTKLRGDWQQGYIETLNENTRYYPEAIYDNYITYLEENGFINEDGTMNLQNKEGKQLPTLEQYTTKQYETDEIDEQNNYELQIGETQHNQPPIETKEDEEKTKGNDTC